VPPAAQPPPRSPPPRSRPTGATPPAGHPTGTGTQDANPGTTPPQQPARPATPPERGAPGATGGTTPPQSPAAAITTRRSHSPGRPSRRIAEPEVPHPGGTRVHNTAPITAPRPAHRHRRSTVQSGLDSTLMGRRSRFVTHVPEIGRPGALNNDDNGLSTRLTVGSAGSGRRCRGRCTRSRTWAAGSGSGSSAPGWSLGAGCGACRGTGARLRM
jgi:hypothetical protein